MSLDDTILYEQFAAARLRAVELTDAYRETSADDPRRAVLWEGVVRQTELARGLLESWLAASDARRPAHALGRAEFYEVFNAS